MDESSCVGEILEYVLVTLTVNVQVGKLVRVAELESVGVFERVWDSDSVSVDSCESLGVLDIDLVAETLADFVRDMNCCVGNVSEAVNDWLLVIERVWAGNEKLELEDVSCVSDLDLS